MTKNIYKINSRKFGFSSVNIANHITVSSSKAVFEHKIPHRTLSSYSIAVSITYQKANLKYAQNISMEIHWLNISHATKYSPWTIDCWGESKKELGNVKTEWEMQQLILTYAIEIILIRWMHFLRIHMAVGFWEEYIENFNLLLTILSVYIKLNFSKLISAEKFRFNQKKDFLIKTLKTFLK